MTIDTVIKIDSASIKMLGDCVIKLKDRTIAEEFGMIADCGFRIDAGALDCDQGVGYISFSLACFGEDILRIEYDLTRNHIEELEIMIAAMKCGVKYLESI